MTSPATIRRWRKYLADERAEAAVYRDLAGRRDGEEREILLALAEAEARHEAHWLALLGDDVGRRRVVMARERNALLAEQPMHGSVLRRDGSRDIASCRRVVDL